MATLMACQPRVGSLPPHLGQEKLSLDFLYQQLLERQKPMNDLKSIVRTTIEGKQRKHSFKQVLLIRDEDSIRIDTMNVFGQTLGVFIFNGQGKQGHQRMLYDPGKNRVFMGREVQTMLEQTLGMNVDLQEYISVFYGNIPRLESIRLVNGHLSDDQKVYRLVGKDTERKAIMEIEVDAFKLLPLKVTRIEQGRQAYIVRWDDYRQIDRGEFPFFLEIRLPQQKEKLTVKYTDPVLNAGIPPDAFELSIAGIRFSLTRQ